MSREIIIFSFQLQKFFEIEYTYIDFFNEKNREFFKQIIIKNFRSSFISREIFSAKNERAR